MQARKPIVAGQFYPGRHDSCVDEINECLKARTLGKSLPETIVAGIVPHAGWTFSGSLAALVFSAVKQRHEKVHTFVIFGAAHGYFGQSPAVYETGSWITPLGEVAIDEELAGAVLSSGTAVSDSAPHRAEHSIEVQLPFIQYLYPEARIVPVMVPPTAQAPVLGERVAALVKDRDGSVMTVGTSDLSHYGQRYAFKSHGTGRKALEWVKNENDKRIIDLCLKMAAEEIVPEATRNLNACGGGALAATVAYARALGVKKGELLHYTTSYDVLPEDEEPSDFVGYAGIVF